VAYNSQLVEQQILAQELYPVAGEKSIYAPRIGALQAVAKETTSRLDALYSDPEKKKSIKVYYDIPYCTGDVDNAGSSCDITGTEPDSSSVTYSLSRTRSAAPFAINERKFETSMHSANEFVVKNTLIQEKKLLEDLNARIAAVINTTGNLTYLGDTGWDGIVEKVDTTDKNIYVPASMWTISGIGQLVEEIAARSMMLDPYIISGRALWALMFQARHTVGDKGDTDRNIAAGVLGRTYFDLTLDATLGAEKFFLIDRGILTILNRPDWDNTVPEQRPDDTVTYKRALAAANAEMVGPIMLNTQGGAVNLEVDVRMKRKCSARTEYTQHHALDLSADVVKAPTNTCTAEWLGTGNVYTGIFAFQCGTPANPAS
jgi:hypothetical protein